MTDIDEEMIRLALLDHWHGTSLLVDGILGTTREQRINAITNNIAQFGEDKMFRRDPFLGLIKPAEREP